MAKAATDNDKTSVRRESPSRPYVPSWVDRLTALIDRLPESSWLYYLGIGLTLFLVQTGILWGEGVYPIGTFLAVHGFFAGMIAFDLALHHYLDNAADAALATLRPTLKTDEEEYEALRYRLITLPALPTLLANLIAATTAVLLNETLGAPSGLVQLADSPISSALAHVMYVMVWWMWGAFIYHAIHQLRVIDRIYTDHTRINPFRVRRLYAFSGVTAVTAVNLTIPTYAWLVINQILLDPIAIAISLPVTVLALVVFVWPQLGVRRLLAVEKGQMLDDLAKRFEAAIVDLRQGADSREPQGIDDSIKVLTALEIEEKALNKVSTWPWQPETMRYLVTALFLPLVLWLTQFIMRRILAP
jgi:hypothetical protein